VQYRFTTTAFFIWCGLLIWTADFLFVYIFSALACARRFGDITVAGLPIVPVSTTLVSLVALTCTVAVMRVALKRERADSPSGEPSKLIRFLALALGALAVIAIVWSALPPLVLRSHC
jgi:hypothetical protein